MKKLSLIIGLLVCSLSVHANPAENSAKEAVVKKLYAEHLKSNTNFNIGSLFTRDFNLVLAHDNKVSETNSDVACIDYDYIVQGQDFDAKEIKRTLKIKALPNGRVEVQFNNFDSKNIVHYVLTCQNNRCLIDDIIEQDETRKQPKNSFKQSVRQCLRTKFPKISPHKK